MENASETSSCRSRSRSRGEIAGDSFVRRSRSKTSPDRNFRKRLLEQFDTMVDVLVDLTVALNVLREPIHKRLEADTDPDKVTISRRRLVELLANAGELD